jgi:hypothetical protein
LPFLTPSLSYPLNRGDDHDNFGKETHLGLDEL